MPTLSVTCEAPVNIALIKYWGKRDEDLVLPLNPSLSITLNMDTLRTRTTVVASKQFEKDRLWLNGQEQDLSTKRLQTCLAKLRQGASDRYDVGELVVRKEEWQEYRFHIVSENNFPTAAGLASSASGLACLVYSIAQLLSFKETFPGEISAIARQGSGSACRSLYGGFVLWEAGTRSDGMDSFARQIASENSWKSLRILILIVNEERKKTSSTTGMQASVHTSPLLTFRASHVVPQRIHSLIHAVETHDFPTLAAITMQESNQFHACCLDSFPPIFYLNDVSRRIISFVHEYNECKEKIKVAYTFDAGPNAVLLMEDEDLEEFLNMLQKHFGCFPVTNTKVKTSAMTYPESKDIIRGLATRIGEGPRVVTNSLSSIESLADKNGLPKC
eukprot:jgi/Galph1/6098/GphlegSOOS_G4730.1